MRIGVDATCWANGRGYGRFTREIVGAMVLEAPSDQFLCFLDERAAAVFTLDAPNVVRVLVPQRVSPTQAAGSGSARSLPDLLRFTRAVGERRLGVFFAPAVPPDFRRRPRPRRGRPAPLPPPDRLHAPPSRGGGPGRS